MLLVSLSLEKRKRQGKSVIIGMEHKTFEVINVNPNKLSYRTENGVKYFITKKLEKINYGIIKPEAMRQQGGYNYRFTCREEDLEQSLKEHKQVFEVLIQQEISKVITEYEEKIEHLRDQADMLGDLEEL